MSAADPHEDPTPRAPAADLSPGTGLGVRLLRRVVVVEPREVAALLWSAALFFAVFCSYYTVRPLRETMGILGGNDKLQWMFTATFVTMLLLVPVYSAVVARWPRRVFVPGSYHFFAGCLLLSFPWIEASGEGTPVWVARTFYVWAAVFSLYVVSVSWELMVDLWRRDQGERLFGFIAAGGSAGALVGPLLAGWAAPRVGLDYLPLLAVVGLELAALCVARLLALAGALAGAGGRARDELPVGGGVWAGFTQALASPRLLGICGYVLLLALTGTFLYFEQQTIVAAAVPAQVDQTVLFARVDFVINLASVTLQALVVGRLMPRIGLGWTLALLPLATLAGLLSLAAAPVLAVVVAAQVARRAADYALAKPAREVLFTTVGREAKYKAKSFIDTVVYRGGDVVSGWVFHALRSLGLGLAGLALVAAPIAAAWAVFGLALGRAAGRPSAGASR
jgi:AAA family ATP:ADP antiporter